MELKTKRQKIYLDITKNCNLNNYEEDSCIHKNLELALKNFFMEIMFLLNGFSNAN